MALNKHTPPFMQIRSKGVSMTPIITSGARIILNISPNQSYGSGDVVAYVDYKRNIVVHRILFSIIIPSGHRQYLLKGDNNIRPDQYISARHLIGKVQKVVYPWYDIDLMTPFSVCIAQYIAYCGKFTIRHRWFYTLERMLVSCLALIIIWPARWGSLSRDDIE